IAEVYTASIVGIDRCVSETAYKLLYNFNFSPLYSKIIKKTPKYSIFIFTFMKADAILFLELLSKNNKKLECLG
ncbi:hypothetical protein CR199_13550, partial [Enterococcus faecium]